METFAGTSGVASEQRVMKLVVFSTQGSGVLPGASAQAGNRPSLRLRGTGDA
jgi:hypothetical protein